MANVLADFTKRREFLACIDSDGCVMDTVRVKHMDVLCPELIRTFALEAYADLVTDAWATCTASPAGSPALKASC